MQATNTINDDDMPEEIEASPPRELSGAPDNNIPQGAEESWLDEPITPEDAGAFLKIPYSTLSKWRHNGTGPDYLKLGGRLVRYRRRDLLDWLNNCARSPSNDNGET